MPYHFSTFTLPGGARAVRADASGDLGKEDVAYFLEQAGEGKPLFGPPLLIATRDLKSLSSEARLLLVRSVYIGTRLAWCALVLRNPVLRVAVNFMLRVKGHPKLKLFETEEDAIHWLDERAQEDAAALRRGPHA